MASVAAAGGQNVPEDIQIELDRNKALINTLMKKLQEERANSAQKLQSAKDELVKQVQANEAEHNEMWQARQNLTDQAEERVKKAEEQAKKMAEDAKKSSEAAREHQRKLVEQQRKFLEDQKQIQKSTLDEFQKKVARDQDKFRKAQEEERKQHQSHVEKLNAEKLKSEENIKKMKQILVQSKHAETLKAQMGAHNPGLPSSHGVNPMHGALDGTGLNEMFAAGPEGLEAMDGETAQQIPKSVDELLAEQQERVQNLKSHLKLQAEETDIFKQYKAQEAQLNAIKAEV